MKLRKFYIVVIVLLVAITIVFCWPKPFDYSCKFPESRKIVFGLIRNHLFLAEYERYIEIGGVRYFLGIDTGGKADIHIYSKEDNWIVVTSDCHWIMISMKDLSVTGTKMDYNDSVPQKYIGRCTFIGHAWGYLPAKNSEFIGPFILKGG
jgi:hypothetical protein